jgi:hypothetical protein
MYYKEKIPKSSQKSSWLKCAMVVDWANKTLPTTFYHLKLVNLLATMSAMRVSKQCIHLL